MRPEALIESPCKKLAIIVFNNIGLGVMEDS